MANALQLGQYELDDSFLFGTRSPYAVPNSYLVGSFGEEQGDISNFDESLLLEDGTIFGEDYSGGMSIVFQVNIRNRKGLSVDRELATFKKAWRPLNVRRQSGAVQKLRMNKYGTTRIVYGRGRDFMPTYGQVANGWCPVDAKFKCVDENYYDNEVDGEDIGLTVPPSSGFFSPFTAPLTVSQYSEAVGVLDIEGDNPTWPLLTFKGPSINPTLEIDDWFKISLSVALNHTEYVTVDPRPWSRGAFRSNGISMTGRFTSDSTIWREMLLEPGRHFAVYTAIDETLSSSVRVDWRKAWATA